MHVYSVYAFFPRLPSDCWNQFRDSRRSVVDERKAILDTKPNDDTQYRPLAAANEETSRETTMIQVELKTSILSRNPRVRRWRVVVPFHGQTVPRNAHVTELEGPVPLFPLFLSVPLVTRRTSSIVTGEDEDNGGTIARSENKIEIAAEVASRDRFSPWYHRDHRRRRSVCLPGNLG